MRFGVNYTPSVGWFHSWLDFNPDLVRKDFDAISTLGVDHVRIFPLWGIVQPHRTLLRRSALDDIGRTIDIAGEFGLSVNVDALQGHLSSFDFLPSWLLTWHRRNMFTDPDVVDAEVQYVRALGEVLASRSNVVGLTLGNELNQFASAPHPDPHLVTEREAGEWLGQLIEAAGRDVPGLVTHSMYDAAWYDDRQPFTPEHAAIYGDATIVHSWVFNGAARLGTGLAPASVRHAEYLLQLAAAWHADPARPLWLQEVGAPTNVVTETEAPDFIEATLRHAVAVPNLWGVTWWCSHDVSRGLADFPEHEYDLGLFTSEGRLKPTGRRFAEVTAELRSVAAPQPSPVALVLDDIRLDYRSSCAPGGLFFTAWQQAADAEGGAGPQILLASRPEAMASDILAQRGISRVLATESAAAPLIP